jgi:hypothetical protein
MENHGLSNVALPGLELLGVIAGEIENLVTVASCIIKQFEAVLVFLFGELVAKTVVQAQDLREVHHLKLVLIPELFCGLTQIADELGHLLICPFIFEPHKDANIGLELEKLHRLNGFLLVRLCEQTPVHLRQYLNLGRVELIEKSLGFIQIRASVEFDPLVD